MDFLQSIPIYVFFIFFGLLYLGLSQIKTKNKKFKTTTILPIALFFFGLYGLYNLSFSYSFFFILWLVFWFFIWRYIWKKENFIYQAKSDSFQVKGSFIPLVIIMIIFFTKFIVWFLQTKNPEVFSNTLLLVSFIVIYGILSGIFLSRLYLLFKLRKWK